MPFITNQWLRHLPSRQRPHEPVRTELAFEDKTDSWSRENKIKAALRLIREDGVYQAVFLTSEDLNYVVPQLVSATNIKTKELLALQVLRSLDQKACARVLASHFDEQSHASRDG